TARSCFNWRSTRSRKFSDGPIWAKFHESSRPASTRLNSNARTDRVNSQRTERICDKVVPAPGASDKSLSASRSSMRATSPARYASWTSCQSEEIDAPAADRFPSPADQSSPVRLRWPAPHQLQNADAEHPPAVDQIGSRR